MEFVRGEVSSLETLPPGVTSITDPKHQKRVSRTLSKAVSLHLEGKLDSAAKLLSRAIETGEQDPGLYSALGHIHYENRDYQAAATTYQQLVELDHHHRTAHFNLGVCLGNLKDWARAAEAFHSAFECDASRADALLGLGICLLHIGQPKDSVETLDRYLNLFPDNEQALFGKAVGLQQTGHYAEATEYYRKILGRNPRCEEALSNLV